MSICLDLKTKHQIKKAGFTLIELIIYVATFAIIATVITLFVINLIKVQAKTRVLKETNSSAQETMNLMLMELKNGESINLAGSIFDVSPGKLSIETTMNTPIDETTTFVDFYLNADNRFVIKREGMNEEMMLPENIKMKQLIFKRLFSENTESIRIEMIVGTDNEDAPRPYQAEIKLISSVTIR